MKYEIPDNTIYVLIEILESKNINLVSSINTAVRLKIIDNLKLYLGR